MRRIFEIHYIKPTMIEHYRSHPDNLYNPNNKRESWLTLRIAAKNMFDALRFAKKRGVENEQIMEVLATDEVIHGYSK